MVDVIPILIRAGVSPELVGLVAAAIAEARSEGALMRGEAARASNAQRQAKWRSGQKAASSRNESNVTDVTNVCGVTPEPRERVFSIGEELELPSNETTSRQAPLSKTRERNAGSRISVDFVTSEANRQFARDRGLSDPQIDEALDEFKIYWGAVPGAKGRKLDWEGTFRNRLREIAGKFARAGPRQTNGHKPQTNLQFDVILDSFSDDSPPIDTSAF